MELDKFKRFIVVGCSFTNYYWPTWADILKKQMPDAEYFNFGRCGAGNLFISSRLIEAATKLTFNKDDLVMVMWTTICREDRYFHGNWCLPGNIYTQNTYSKEFVSKFADPEGYLLRDLSLIKLSVEAMKSYDSTTVFLNCQPFDVQQDRDHNKQLKDGVKDILNTYKSLKDDIQTSMYELEMNMQWENGHVYYDPNHGKFPDYHPSPIRYFNYLNKLNLFDLNSSTHNYAMKATDDLLKTKTKQDIENLFNNEPNINHSSVRTLCF